MVKSDDLHLCHEHRTTKYVFFAQHDVHEILYHTNDQMPTRIVVGVLVVFHCFFFFFLPVRFLGDPGGGPDWGLHVLIARVVEGGCFHGAVGEVLAASKFIDHKCVSVIDSIAFVVIQTIVDVGVCELAVVVLRKTVSNDNG